MSARRPGGCPGPEVPGAQAEGRLSPTAVCHISAPRPRRAVLPRSSRGGHGGGRKAGPEPLCMNAPGSRAIGCVAFQPTAGTITSVASCPRGGDGDLRRAARSDGTPPRTARLASVMRRWVGWAARWRGRRGRDRGRWPRFRPDSRRRGVSMPAGSRRCRMAGGAPGRPCDPGERAEPVFGQQGVRLCLPAASGPAASASGAFPATSVSSMSRALAVIQHHVAPIRSSACCGSRRVTRTGGRVRPAARLPAPAGARPGHPAGTARSQPW